MTAEHTVTRMQARVQVVLAGLVMIGVLLASLVGLTEVAELVNMQDLPLPLGPGEGIHVPVGTIGLILAFDGMQLSAGWATHTIRGRAPVVLMVVCAAASGIAQGWAGVNDPANLNVLWPVVFFFHASPAVFLIGSEYLVLKAVSALARVGDDERTAPARRTTTTKSTRGARPGAAVATSGRPATPPPAGAPAHEEGRSTPSPNSVPAGREGPRRPSGVDAGPLPDDEIARRAAQLLRDRGERRSRDKWRSAVNEVRPGYGQRPADRLLELAPGEVVDLATGTEG